MNVCFQFAFPHFRQTTDSQPVTRSAGVVGKQQYNGVYRDWTQLRGSDSRRFPLLLCAPAKPRRADPLVLSFQRPSRFPAMNTQQYEKVKSAKGFIAALDQSGGSTPKAL